MVSFTVTGNVLMLIGRTCRLLTAAVSPVPCAFAEKNPARHIIEKMIKIFFMIFFFYEWELMFAVIKILIFNNMHNLDNFSVYAKIIK